MPVLIKAADPFKVRLLAQLKLSNRVIRQRFNEIIEWLRDQNKLDDVAALIQAGDVEAAMRTFDRAARMLANTTSLRYIAAAENMTSEIARRAKVPATFETASTRAARHLENNRLRTIREFTTRQRAAVRTVMAQATAEGLNPRAQAQLFRDAIGLTEAQAQHVVNYRRALEANSMDALSRELRDRRLDRTLRAIQDGRRKPLTRAEIERHVQRYRENYIDFRAEVIARTEAMRAVHTGSEEAWAQAIDDGDIQKEQVRRVWLTARDARVRDSHYPMHGQERAPGEPFISSDGVKLMFPGDPTAPIEEIAQCRCIVVTRLRPVTQGWSVPKRPHIPPGEGITRRVRAGDLRSRDISQLGDVSGDKARLAEFRRLRESGSMPPAINVSVGSDGELLLEGGRHRLAATLDDELIDVLFSRRFESP